MINKDKIKKEMLKNKKNTPSIGTWFFNNRMHDFVDKIIITEIIIFSIILSFISAKIVTLLFFRDNFNDPVAISIISIILEIIYLPISVYIIEENFTLIWFIKDRKKDIENYSFLNQSLKHNGKYYSLWYILFNYEKFDSILNFSDIDFKENFMDCKSFYYDVLISTAVTIKRHDRKNWRNSLPTNRLLSFEEYLKIKKKIIKSNKVDAENREIEAFQKYHDL